ELITTTDPNGKYTVPDPQQWASRLMVFHPDFATLDDQAAGFGTTKMELNRAGDKGVAKAAVYIDGWLGATSGEDGSFSVAHAPKSWQTLEAKSDDLIAMRAKN